MTATSKWNGINLKINKAYFQYVQHSKVINIPVNKYIKVLPYV